MGHGFSGIIVGCGGGSVSDKQKQSLTAGIILAIVVAAGLWALLSLVKQPPAQPPQPNPIEFDGDKPVEIDQFNSSESAGKPITSAEQAAAILGERLPDGTLNFGYRPNPVSTQQFLTTLNKPFLSQAGPELIKKAEANPRYLYRSLYKAYAATQGGTHWVVGRQGIGDCVSWGWAHGADTHLAVLWELGLVSDWKLAATESIYGGSRVEARGVTRGGWSDGSYGSAAAKWVSKWGIVHRQPYEGLFDLTTYSSSRAKDWGNYGNGGQNDNGKLDEIAKSYPIKGVALCRNFEEAAAAIQSGYPIPVCSGQGFSSQRDQQGFCAPRGSWAHCMCFIGVRYDRPGLLCLNSWGPNWVSGPKHPEDMPDGSFWVDAKVVDRMLSGNDSFAVSGYEGFPHRNLNHGDWVQALPQGNISTSKKYIYASHSLQLAP
jgi:hypothetical protein